MSGGENKTAYVGLGSNLGDRQEMFTQALAMMNQIPHTRVAALSALYSTDPEDGAGPGEFLNGVARLETALTPGELLTGLEQIERRLGRMSKGDYRPRTIDLDLLLFGDLILDSPPLVVPHPRLTTRAFVLRPLCDLAPGTLIPPKNMTAADYWARLTSRGSIRPAVGVNRTEMLRAFGPQDGQP